MVADPSAEFAWDHALVLNCLIRDATARIDHAGCSKGAGRAGIETTRAAAAQHSDVPRTEFIFDWLVWCDVEPRENRRQEQPVAMFTRNEHRVFSGEPDSGSCSPTAFEHRTGI